MGVISIGSKQAKKLGLKKNTRISPHLEKCCLLLVSNESFANAEQDIELLTGVRVPHSTQHRLLERSQIDAPQAATPVEALSLDGGNVRIRTPQGQESQWKNYKALQVHSGVGGAYFQENQALLDWVNQQPLSQTVTCLGDGHDGIWNLMAEIGQPAQRREVLDWYHLGENLSKVGGSTRRWKRVKNYLWNGQHKEALAELEGLKSKAADNFRNYLNKHRSRIPNYRQYQEQGISMGSGAVESLVKQIGARVKIVGAQWKAENVSQILKLRCAYLNGSLQMRIFA